VLLERMAGFLTFARNNCLTPKETVERFSELYANGDLKRAKRLIAKANRRESEKKIQKDPTVTSGSREGRGVNPGGSDE
jgi:hypothetical protein